MPRRFFRRRSLSLALLACLLASSAARVAAQDDTMMQAFYWDVPTDAAANNGSWWLNLQGKAGELRRAGVTGVWTPPPSKGNFGIYDMGYGVFDHFDLGNYPVKGTTETRFGSRAELEAMIAAMHAEGIEVYSDIVLNHIFTDYRELEVNPAVESYIRNEATTNTGTHTAYPVNEVVWRIPDAPPGDYLIQIKGYNLNCAAAQDERGYEVYATWTNPDPDFPYAPNVPQVAPYNFESEPNNGAGNSDDFPGSGRRIWGHVNACGDIDEYKITLAEAHDINLIIDAKRGAPGTALTGADPRNGYRIAHAYGPGGVDFAAATMQVLTYSGVNVAADYNVTHTGAGEQDWLWNYTHFHPVDEFDYLQSDCCDDRVVPNAKIFGQDFNTFDARTLTQGGVQARLKYWGQWLTDTVGFDGYRLDFVRGFQEDFAADWIKAMPLKPGGGQRYVVGEYFSGNKQRLREWVQAMHERGADADVFDFNLKYTLNGMANGTSASFDMRALNHAGMVRDDTGNVLSGLDVNTFVENHDTGKDNNQWVFKDWQLPYAYVLFAEGRPTIFYAHFYGNTLRSEHGGFTTAAPASLQTDLKKLTNIRRNFLGGDMIVLSETGNPFPANDAANAYVARRRGDAGAGKPGGILVLNNHETQTKCLYVDNAPAGSGYADWANTFLRDATGNQSADAEVFADGRVQVCAGPRGYAVYVPVAAAASLPVISGRLTDGAGQPIGGATVTLSGSLAATATTDAAGNYSFRGLVSGGDYTVTPSAAGLAFAPASRSYPNLGVSQSADFAGAAQSSPPPSILNPGDVVISEFRLRGPSGANDEYVELYNRTDSDITVGAADGSAGWAVASLDAGGLEARPRFVVPAGASIPARGHYLAANASIDGGPYSLAAAVPADLTYTTDLPDDSGLALFNTANPAGFTPANRLDAAGFAGATLAPADLYREGAGLPTVGAAALSHAFVRKLASGTPQDTNANAADFQLVSAAGGAVGAAQSILGAPGPENSASPVQRNGKIKSSLIDACAASTSAPNRVRDLTPDPANNSSAGTLAIRRKFTNNTGADVTRLRFRIVDLTTAPAAPGAADLRARTSATAVVSVSASCGGAAVQVRGLTLEDAAVQPEGGGVNSTLAAGSVSLATPLAAGASVNVGFLLGVEQSGNFRFFINVEALPGEPGAGPSTRGHTSARGEAK